MGRMAAACLGIVLITSACSGSASTSTTTSTTAPVAPTTVITAPASTTTGAPVTTLAPVTTTALPPPTTAAPTTTTSVATTTTTTIDPAYYVLELRDDGLGFADFGDDDDAVVAYVTDVLGPPANDTGWVDSFDFGVCPSPTARQVRWGTPGRFELLFYRGGTDFAPDGTEHFGNYWYFGPDVLAFTVFTPEGVTVRDSVLDFRNAYGTAFVIYESFIPGLYFWSVDPVPADNNFLGGFADGEAPGSFITSVGGGAACGE